MEENDRDSTQPKLSPVHPGEILLKEFLRPMGISQYRLAKSLSVPPRRINEVTAIVLSQRTPLYGSPASLARVRDSG